VRFPRTLDPAVPVMGLGLGSNMIVRDGGVPGVVVRLGKAFAGVEQLDATTLRCGGGASGILVSSKARDAGIAGVEFLRSIPGTVGGFVRMNGGAYGRETSDISWSSARSCCARASGARWPGDLSAIPIATASLPEGAIVVSATFRGHPASPAAIQAEMDRIAAAREESQPLRSKTGGSTFKNPEGHKAWALIDAAGCRGLRSGDAQVSEKHTNFLLNLGEATSGRYRGAGRGSAREGEGAVGVTLEWEIQRVGVGNPQGRGTERGGCSPESGWPPPPMRPWSLCTSPC
jgi:UDP-N-acetylmuramate dehydrogenase